ncbi:hypothetical protein ACOSP7_023056 [Xanthoceras sorbifolium]
MEYRSLRSDSLSSSGRCSMLKGYEGVKGDRVEVAFEAQLYLKKELASNAWKLRDFKEVISFLRRKSDSLKLSEARAKMAEQESAAHVEELGGRVAELVANVEQLQKNRKVEVGSLAEQVEGLVERFETIAGDAVVKIKAELMAEYKEGKVDHWCPDEDIAA